MLPQKAGNLPQITLPSIPGSSPIVIPGVGPKIKSPKHLPGGFNADWVKLIDADRS